MEVVAVVIVELAAAAPPPPPDSVPAGRETGTHTHRLTYLLVCLVRQDDHVVCLRDLAVVVDDGVDLRLGQHAKDHAHAHLLP